ncbi:hypothetical protein B7G68_09915 [Caulobacter segnis]|uniref:Uncharacterized protein n=2 Tax=Caulobacter segnis TaxID=88688 RepID=D5VJJ7_CAUST|nr:hypothetical protein [Caulobacter segnis]ADG10406.1 conserved hypothetical protein [Caulobacter segnis ATCC 21756]AVQ02135.1 hypothetical protein B7G68_09915 [Caulobacter segnis]
MRHSKWLAAALLIGAGTTALSACHRAERSQEHRLGRREPMRVIDRLDCPEQQGALRRVSVAPDGQSCGYESPMASVDLRLVRLNGGDAEAALAPIEAELKGVMPPPPPTPTPPHSAKGDKNHASIHLPGVSIDSHGDTADIRIGRLTINSDGGAAEVKINKNVSVKSDDGKGTVSITADEEHGEGDVAIRASEGGAEIRARKPGDDVRSTLIIANDKAPKGFRLAGYEARGPKGGPLAVAVVKAKTRDTDDHDLFKDMKALVRRNVGG